MTDADGKAKGAVHESFLLPWNDASVLEGVLAAHGADVAAVLMEPICINGGGVLPNPRYLRGTFNGFPLGIAAVKATLEILAEEDRHCYDRMASRMRAIHSSFISAAERHGLSFEMKSVDAVGVYHSTAADDDGPIRRIAAQHVVKLTSEAMAENGFVSNLNRFYGSISVSDADVSLFEERIERVFEIV